MLKKKGTAIFDDYGNFVEFIEEGGSESPKASPSPRPSISDPMERMLRSALGMYEFGGATPSTTGELLKMLQRNYIDPEGMPVATTEGMEKQGHKFDDKPLHVPFFYRKLASIMRDNMYDREVSGFRSGKLNHKVLYKVMLDNPRVFKRKFERKNKKYNVVVMVDVSGSMGTYMTGGKERSDVAFEMCEVLIKGFNQNGINYAIQTYNSEPHTTKEMYSKVNQNLLLNRLRYDLDPNGGNHEVRALKYINKTLTGIKDGKNIVLFITDGESGNSREDIKKEVSIIEKRSKLFTYGMATESVKSYFRNPAICNTKEEFMGAVIGDLSRYIRRG